jgi:hypothetical protein
MNIIYILGLLGAGYVAGFYMAFRYLSKEAEKARQAGIITIEN